jgi:hypothetical protein
MENMNNVDKITTTSEKKETIYALYVCIKQMSMNFESVGCSFDACR